MARHLAYPEEVVAGSTTAQVEYEYYYDDEPVDITGATIGFRMVNRDDPDDVKIAAGVGSVASGAGGRAIYDLVAADLDNTVLAVYLCQFTITLVSGRVHRSPRMELRVNPAL